MLRNIIVSPPKIESDDYFCAILDFIRKKRQQFEDELLKAVNNDKDELERVIQFAFYILCNKHIDEKKVTRGYALKSSSL